MSGRQPFAERDYYRDPRRRAKSLAVRALSRVTRPLGIDVELRHWYSPVPRVEEIDPLFWERASAMPGVRAFDPGAMLDFAEAELAGALAEFRPPRAWSGRPNEFFLENGLYQGVDADILYAMIRRFRPARIIELGAGFSTLVTAHACERTGETATGPPSSPVTPTPSRPRRGGDPRSDRAAGPAGAGDRARRLRRPRARRRAVHRLLAHRARRRRRDPPLGEVLPRLAPGVLVHVHDVFLPWSYPREWIERNRWYWAEQYLLQAFLAGNDRFRVLWAAYAIHRMEPARLGRLVAHYAPQVPPLSLWMRTA